MLDFGEELIMLDYKKPMLGLNLARVSFWTPEWVFSDLNRAAREWDVLPATPAVAFSPNGYPNSLAPGQKVTSLLANRTSGGHYPAGLYRVAWLGQGKIRVRMDAVDTTSAVPFNVQVTPSDNGIELQILETTPGNPVRAISVLMPTFTPGSFFTSRFLTTIGPFSVLRFMDWQETNNSTLVEPADLPSDVYRTVSTGKGMSLSYIIALCATNGAEPWICVPHGASDTLVAAMATQLKAGLPSRRIFVEYSNEVWNSSFPGQFKYAATKAAAQNIHPDAWYAQRAAQVGALCKSILGDKVVRVLAGQRGNNTRNARILAAMPPNSADVFSVAGYFGGDIGAGDTWHVVRDWTPETLFAELDKELDASVAFLKQAKDAAAVKGLPLVLYEGGQHLAAYSTEAKDDAKLAAIYLGANRDPRMGTLYQKLFDAWKAMGGGLFCLFSSVVNPGRSGYWGLKEYQDQAPAPKYDVSAAEAVIWITDQTAPPPTIPPDPIPVPPSIPPENGSQVWEVINFTGGQSTAPLSLHRLLVPGGWLVKEPQGPMVYYPNTEHNWLEQV